MLKLLRLAVPPRNYCIIENPVLRDKDGAVVFEEIKSGKEVSKQAKLRHADQEIRLARDPFPLYPGSRLYHSCLACLAVIIGA